MEIFTTKVPILILFTLGIILTTFSSNCYLSQRTYGHNFTPNESASFVAFAYQLQVESELVKVNVLANNITLAQTHANKASSLLTPTIIFEIFEKDIGIAKDLRAQVSDLQKTSSSTENQQHIENVLSNINSVLSKAVDSRVSLPSANSSKIAEREIEDVKDSFQTNGGFDIKGDTNNTILALSVADLVDSVLVNYGNAFGVEFDMTNMSNIMLKMVFGNNNVTSSNPENNTNMKTDSMINSPNAEMSMSHGMKTIYSLANMSDYQSAHAIAVRAYDIFDSKLRPMAIKENHTIPLVSNLEDGLSQLQTSIRSKASPVDIMMIVHTRIHPTLLQIFDLELRK